MIATQDFAREVWLSLENIRERLAALETEARHTRHHLQRLEEQAAAAAAVAAAAAGESRPATGRRRRDRDDDDAAADSGAVLHLRISRKTLGSLGGGGVVGGGLLAGVMGLGRALGWW